MRINLNFFSAILILITILSSCATKSIWDGVEVFKRNGKEYYLAKKEKPFLWKVDSPVELAGEYRFWGLLKETQWGLVPRVGWFEKIKDNKVVLEGIGVFSKKFSIEYEKSDKENKVYRTDKILRNKIEYGIITYGDLKNLDFPSGFFINKERNRYEVNTSSQILKLFQVVKKYKNSPVRMNTLTQVEFIPNKEEDLLVGKNLSDGQIFKQFFRIISPNIISKKLGIKPGLLSIFPEYRNFIEKRKVSRKALNRSKTNLFLTNEIIRETWLNLKRNQDSDIFIRLPEMKEMLSSIKNPFNRDCYGEKEVLVLGGICSKKLFKFPLYIARSFNKNSFFLEIWKNETYRELFLLTHNRFGWVGKAILDDEIKSQGSFTFEETKDILLAGKSNYLNRTKFSQIESKNINLKKPLKKQRVVECPLYMKAGEKSRGLLNFDYSLESSLTGFLDFTRQSLETKKIPLLQTPNYFSNYFRENVFRAIKIERPLIRVHIAELTKIKDTKIRSCSINKEEVDLQLENLKEKLELYELILGRFEKIAIPEITQFENRLKGKTSLLTKERRDKLYREEQNRLERFFKDFLVKVNSTTNLVDRIKFIKKEHLNRLKGNIYNGSFYTENGDPLNPKAMYYIQKQKFEKSKQALDLEFQELVQGITFKEFRPEFWGAVFFKKGNVWLKSEFFENSDIYVEVGSNRLDNSALYTDIYKEALAFCWEGNEVNEFLCYGPYKSLERPFNSVENALAAVGCNSPDYSRTINFNRGKVYFCNYGLNPFLYDISYRYDFDPNILNSQKSFQCLKNHPSRCHLEAR